MAGITTVPNAQSPAFLLRRPAGGDYNRAGSLAGLEEAAALIRWDVAVPDSLFDALLVSQPVDYDAVQVWWGAPPEGLVNWTTLCVVRSGFGHPSTPTDGVIVHYADRPVPYDPTGVPGTFIDTGLPPGRWYYYTLFFRLSSAKWVAVATTHSLVPIDYRHREHLLGLVPPFYLSRESEDSTTFVTRWMTMIGYDLDYTRTLAEGVQQIYDPDSAAQPLLEALGQQNFGFIKPSALGDIRYRSVMGMNRDILFRRGTAIGLESYIEAVFRSEVTVSDGLNELLLVDDAEFHTGVGNWCPMPWRIGYLLATGRYGANQTPPLTLPIDAFPTRKVKIESFVEHEDNDPATITWPDSENSPFPLPDEILAARGVARIQAPTGEHLAVTCGAGQQKVIVDVDSQHHLIVRDEQHFDAPYRGIPITQYASGAMPVYYLSFWSRRDPGNFAEQDLIVFGFALYARDPATQGFSDGFRGVTTLTTLGGFDGWQSRSSDNLIDPEVEEMAYTVRSVNTGIAGDDEWEHCVASFQIPEGVRYLVPFIWYRGESWVDPITTARYLTGVMVNESQGAGADQVYLLDEYLRISDQGTPDQFLIGGPGQDLPSRPDYKILDA